MDTYLDMCCLSFQIIGHTFKFLSDVLSQVRCLPNINSILMYAINLFLIIWIFFSSKFVSNNTIFHKYHIKLIICEGLSLPLLLFALCM